MLSGTLLKGLGALLAVVVVLSVVATLVGIVLSIVATIVTAVVAVAIVATLLLAVVGLVSLFGDGGTTDTVGQASGWRDRIPGLDESDPDPDVDPVERLRQRYVDGEMGEPEFERRMALLLDSPDEEGREYDATTRTRGSRGRGRSFER